MRILYILYKDNTSSGGSLRVAESILLELKKRGIPFLVIFIYSTPGILSSQFPENCFYLNAKNGKGYLSFITFLKKLFHFKPNIIHLIDPVYWIQGLLLFLNYKSILHVHGGYWNNKNKYRTKALWYLSRKSVDFFIAITFGSKDALVKNGFAKESNIEVVYNSIDLRKLEQRSENAQIRNKLNIPDNVKLIGSVGRVVQPRGFEDLIRLLCFLDTKWHVLIVGDGPYINELLKIISNKGLQDRVHFSGQVDDVVPYYKEMEIYGFFARYDSFGLALADAMLLNIPVFGLKGAGEYDDLRNPLITDTNSSFIKRPDHLDQWRSEVDQTLISLSKLITDYEINPTKFISKKNDAHQHVIKEFNPEIQINQLLKIYNNLNSSLNIRKK